MASLKERFSDSWKVLFGLKRATTEPRGRTSTDRIGSDPVGTDAEMAFYSQAYQYYQTHTHLEPDRISVYSDMDEMFLYVLAASALDAYVEDALSEDPRTGLSVWPVSDNPQVQGELFRLFDTLEIEDRFPGELWSLGKYGDLFDLLLYDKRKGVFDAVSIEPRIVWRHEGLHRVLRGFSVSETSDETRKPEGIPRYKPWDLVHYRIRGRRTTDPYGVPFFMNVRLVYKVLRLMEEQMIIYRMQMHPDRLVFKVFTGNAGPEERMRQMHAWRRALEKQISLDHSTRTFRGENAPWHINANLYFPVGSNDNSSGVEKFPGSSNSGDIFDIEHFRDLFFAGIRMPKAYMGFEDSQGYRGTDTLSAQSIKFSRGVRRLQRHGLQGLVRLSRIHLAIRGIDSRRPENAFRVQAAPVSYLDEAHRAELYAKRFESVSLLVDIGQRMADTIGINIKVWGEYVLREFAGLEESLVAKLLLPPDSSSPDLTYTPSQGTLQFEGKDGEMKRRRLQDAILESTDLQDLLRTLPVVLEDQTLSSSFSSQWDRFDLRLPQVLDANSRSFDAARELSEKEKLKRGKESRERLREELRKVTEIAESMVASP
jgi:hypothetical protein